MTQTEREKDSRQVCSGVCGQTQGLEQDTQEAAGVHSRNSRASVCPEQEQRPSRALFKEDAGGES